MLSSQATLNKEIWILGDFNTDLLKRNDSNTVKILAFTEKNGLTHYIKDITRPNVKGDSCIDLIMSNCLYVNSCGINDFDDQYFLKNIGKNCSWPTIEIFDG